jgi:amino acid adenylation domain-containing protein
MDETQRALSPPTIVDLLRSLALRQPERQIYTFLQEGETEAAGLTAAELDRQARAIGGALQEHARSGDRVLLLLPSSLEFVSAFFGCLSAGLVAVPAYPPRLRKPEARLRAIAADAGPRVVLTTAALLPRVRTALAEVPALQQAAWLSLEELLAHPADRLREVPLSGETLAFLQYTSGSTSTPKGVMVSHGNLLDNERTIQQAFGQAEESVVVGWLPLYHDMGLIGTVLQPLYSGARCVLMSPMAFLQQPVRWLRAISRYRATTSGGPNFAYDLCARKVSPEQAAGLDLSCWQVAFNGAEPVRAETLDRFAAAFAANGFRREAFHPCYGLAEATLFVAGRRPGEPVTDRPFAAGALEAHEARPVAGGDAGARRLVGCGTAWDGQRLAIVDPASEIELAPGQVGEIWLAGPSVTAGYWRQPEETAASFQATLATGVGPFLRTGDLGFLDEGELFITGRIKDLIILRGRNHYPQDLELTSERAHPALRPGCSAAFSVEGSGEERLVLACELDGQGGIAGDAGEVGDAIRQAVAEEHEVRVHEVVLLRAGTIPKTTSGKVRRQACRSGYLEGSLAVVGRSGALQEVGPGEGGPFLGRRKLLALPPDERLEPLLTWLGAEVAGLLEIPPSRVSAETPLTALGLDSLAAVELGQRLAQELRVEVGAASLLAGADLAGLGREVLEQLDAGAEAGPASPRLTAGQPATEHPLSFGQRALWFLQRLTPESGSSHIAAAARVRPALDPEILRRTFEDLSRRHPVLRTTFHAVDGEPRQRVHPEPRLDFLTADASAWSDAELLRRLEEESFRPFDLEAGPLLRVGLFRRAAGEDVMLLAVHHLAADFGTLAVLARELGTLYTHNAQGRPAVLQPLPVTYADWARWMEERMRGAEGARLQRYWEDRLAGAPIEIELPFDRPRSGAGESGSALRFHIEPEQALALQTLARSQGATLFAALLALLQALLHRATGGTDVTVGSPVSGRSLPELASLAGYLVNMVPLRSDLSAAPGFAALLGQVRQTVLGAFEHQDYPFPLLAERLAPVHEPGRTPLFQVAFVLQKGQPPLGRLGAFAVGEPGVRLDLGRLELESFPIEERFSPFDLTLRAAELDAGIAASFLFRADLFDAPTVARLAGHLNALLAGAVESPGRSLGELPLLAEAERQQLLEWNDTASPVQGGARVHELVAAQARARPDTVAVSQEESRITYAELERRATELADRLRSLGIRPELPVGICVERSPDLVLGALAVWKAGGAYVPLDPAYPSEHLGVVIEDTAMPVLLTQRHLLERLPGTRCHIVLLEDPEQGASRGGAAVPAPQAPSGSLLERAYVVYTSGSTGRPKGVEVSHGALLNLVAWHLETFRIQPGDRVSQMAGLAFDATVWELWPALAAGATVHLGGREEARREPRELRDWLVDRQVRIAFLPTPLAEAVLPLEWPPHIALETLLTGGDRLTIRPPAGLPFRLVNNYGPTENAVVATSGPVDADGGGRRPSIGRPVSRVEVLLLDPGLQPVPTGVAGELCLGGASLARGYLGQPELTAERFIPHPWSGRPGERLYRTGDLARRRADGELEFLGRIDQQVKVRGFRIEPGEIESALAAHPGVREACVVLREDLGPGLLACVAPATEGLGADALRRFLAERLPGHMVPSRVLLLDALPLTPNGKVDRSALRRLPLPGRPEGAGQAAPRMPAEELLAALVAEVLGRERVESGDDFFELGGHSLLVAQLAARVQQAFGVDLPLRDVFLFPAVAALARRIEVLRDTGSERAVPPLAPPRPRPRDGALPLSFSQESLWLLSRLDPKSPLYNIPMAVRLTGPLAVPALRSALDRVVARHEALRTVFVAGSAGPLLRIAAEVRAEIPVTDLSGLPAAARQRAASALADAEADRPFDLQAGPLVRACLLRLDSQEHVFLLTLHHIVSDGWSLALLLREMESLYRAALEGGQPSLPPLPVQYADFALWQRSWLAGPVVDGELAWWRDYLAGAPPRLELPTDHPRPPRQSHRGVRRSLRFSAALARQLAALGRREGATLFMVALAALQTLLSRISGQDEILVGTPAAYRTRTELENLIGLFVNTLVLRGDLSANPPFRELLVRARESSLAVFAHQDVPFEKLVEELAPERSLAHSPLFQVMLVLQNVPAAGLNLPGLSTERLDPATRPAKFDLTLFLTEEPDGLLAELGIALDLFDPTTGARLLGQLERLLAAACEDPARPVRDLPLLGASEEQQLLVEWNDTARPVAAVTLQELFDRQVARSPEALAVQAGGETLTFGQLGARADRLAWALSRHGVGLESRVGILLQRSADQIVALLAVLKAGGAYVPLDPAAPRERLHLILDEAGISVVITSEGLLDALPPSCAAVLPGVAAGSEGAASPLPPLPPIAAPENLAYILYTSGSTGRPKGVMIEHRSVVNLLGALRETVYRAAGGPFRVALNAPLVFDASVKQWIQLLDGCSLHIVPEEVRPEASRMLQMLRQQGVQAFDCTPSQLSYLLAAGLLRQPGALERVLVGGEDLPRADWSLLVEARRPGFSNVYGPTECTVDTAVADVSGDRPVLGRPIANVRIHLLDSALNTVPPGVSGELCIGGAGVARGYLGRPGQTAERFIPDPRSPAPGGRLYRSGDLARQLADGTLEYLGRIDHQVKVHGYRIELGEIETVLGEHPDVLAVAVLARADELGQCRLMAYVACHGDRTPSASELRSHLEKKLPAYMMPSGLVVLTELPRTRNGKIDRAALLALGSPAAERGEGAMPVTPLEKVLAGMMAEVLGIGRVGLHDNFFELGGHSMRAAELVGNLREAYGIDLPLFHVFDAPTVAGLAAVLLDSPEWHQTVEELSPALLQLIEPLADSTGGLFGSEER